MAYLRKCSLKNIIYPNTSYINTADNLFDIKQYNIHLYNKMQLVGLQYRKQGEKTNEYKRYCLP